MKVYKLLAVSLAAAFIAACGGGGGGGEPTATPVVSTELFQIQSAYANYFNDTRSYPFTVTGWASGFNVTGSGIVAQSPVTNSTFEGTPVLQKVTTVSGSFVVNGQSFSLAAADTAYVDSNYVPKGWSGDEYVVVTSVANIPVTVKVNDTGLWHTSNRYTASTKTTLLGTSETSFALEPDTASSALLKITQVDRDTVGNIEMTATLSLRMTPAGALTRLSENAIAGPTNLTLTY